MEYLVSVDGGGTKTEFCVFSITSGEKKYFTFGSTNYKTVGLETARANMVNSFHHILSELQIGLKQVRGILIGVSGCDTGEDHEIYRELAGQTGLDTEKIYICNDSELAFFSVAAAPGICVIAGTGSIAVGFDAAGTSRRCGGWGSPLSDAGSGYWIGAEVLKHWICYYDGLESYQKIYKKLHEFYKIGDCDSIPVILDKLEGAAVASCALMISDEAEAGDPFCQDILEKAAKETAKLAYGVYRGLRFHEEEKIDLVESGSIFNGRYYAGKFEEILNRMAEKLNIHYVKLDSSPADSGIELAKEIFITAKEEKNNEQEEKQMG